MSVSALNGWGRAIGWLSVTIAFGLYVLILTGLLLPLAAIGAADGVVTYAWLQWRDWRDSARARVVDPTERTWRRYE